MQSRFSGWSLLATTAMCLVLTGCGSGPGAGPISPVASSAANLAGNWLLAGSLPTGPAVPITRTQLSVTFATVGDQVVGGGRAWVVCPAPSGGNVLPAAIGFSFIVSGQMLSDGGFVTQAQSPTASGVAVPGVNISGHVPSTAGGNWSGSYVIDTRQVQFSCSVMVGDVINAVPIAAVTGRYKATGTMTSSATKTPIIVTMVLQQGVSSATANGTVSNQAYALNGTMTVDGTPCFHTGFLKSIAPVSTTAPAGVGATVFGDSVLPQFTMDDGSHVTMPLFIADTGSSQLNAESLVVSAGSCASSPTQQFQVGNFVRQP